MKNNGGSAFPMLGNVGYQSEWQCEEGMTLRDYFAAKAMAALIRRYDGIKFGWGPESPEHKDLSVEAYFIADEMLKAREVT